ncbi:MAG: GntR family transcriptional regulator [Burkholderiaceae bacterium]
MNSSFAPFPRPLAGREGSPPAAPAPELGETGGADGAPGRGGFLPRTIPEQIADEISMAIIEGRFADGERVTEQGLATQFGVSRGPVRDALRLLARRGVIEIVPRRGNYVKTVSMQGIADLFNVRNALSASAARTMAQRPVESYLRTLDRRIAEMEHLAGRTDDDTDIKAFIHTCTRAVAAIAKGSGNDLLASLLVDLANLSVWNVIWEQPLDFTTAERRSAVSRRFRDVQHAIVQRKPDLAESRMRALLEGIRDHAITTLRALRDENAAPVKLADGQRAGLPR